MGQNKAQKAVAERAKKTAAPQPAAVTEQPKPEAKRTTTPAPAAAPVAASKQQITLDKLKVAWAEKGIDLSKLEAKPDGKFLLVTVAAGWPVIQLGPTGGIVLPQIRSYASAFNAAVDGLAIVQKQQARDEKKATASAPMVKVAATPPAAKAPEKQQATA
jgi:hypothetical protein